VAVQPASAALPRREVGRENLRASVAVAPIRPPVLPAAPRKKNLRVAVAVGAVAVVGVGVLAAAAAGLFNRKPTDETAENPAAPDRPGPAPAGPAARKGVDPRSFIAADFNAAAVIHPRRLLQSPLGKAVADEVRLDQLMKDVGLDLHKVEQMLLVLEPFPGGNVLFSGGGVIRLAEPTDGKQLVSKLLHGDAREAKFQGKTYYQDTGEKVAGMAMCGYVADDRTVVIAPEPTLHKMLSAKGVKSPLTDRLARTDLDADVAAVFVVEPFRPAAREALKSLQEGPLPPHLAVVNTLPDRIQSVTVAVNLSRDPLLKLELEATNAESAGALFDLANTGHEMARGMMPTLKAMLAGAPPDLTDPLFAAADSLLAGIDLRKDGARLVVSVKKPRGLDELPAKVAPLLRETQTAVARPARPVQPRKDFRDLTMDWVRTNNAFGPDHKIVANTIKKLESVGINQGFIYRLGSGLVKSGKQTLLCVWGDELFVFELTAEQSDRYPLEPAASTFTVVSADDLGRIPPEVRLSAPRIDNADRLDRAKKITGTVAFRRLGRGAGGGASSLRLVFYEGGTRAHMYSHSLGADAAKDAGVFSFSFSALKGPGFDFKRTGPLVVFLDLVSFFDADRKGKPIVVSNPLVLLVNVAPEK
jgi:hypothetical protein